MLKVKTSTGFECKIDKSILNKYRFVKLLAKIDKEPQATTELVTMLLGKQEDALMEHLGGDPTCDEIANEIKDIFEAIKEDNETKNL